MSAFPSNYIVDKVNDHIYKGTAISLGATRYLALYTSNPGPTNTGTEASGGSYSRKSLSFAASTGGVSSTSAAITFAGMPAGVFTHYAVCDAATAGNLIVYGALPGPVTTNNGDDITIASGDIDLSLSGS